jgi:16S rRNA processing protein RimM
MATHDPDALLLVGRVGKAHGVHGEVKVIPETDDPHRLTGLTTVFLGQRPSATVRHTVASVWLQQTKRGLIAVFKLDDIDTREAAAALGHQGVFVPEEELPPLEDDEFFIHDLVGLQVVTDQGEPIGLIEDVLEGPAHSIVVVHRPGQPDSMIPVVPAFIAAIDLEAGQVVVQPIEGLLD